MTGDSKGDCSWLKASQEGCYYFRCWTRPKLRAKRVRMRWHFAQLFSVQNAIGTESSSQRKTRGSRLGQTMGRERSPEGENEKRKPGTRARSGSASTHLNRPLLTFTFWGTNWWHPPLLRPARQVNSLWRYLPRYALASLLHLSRHPRNFAHSARAAAHRSSLEPYFSPAPGAVLGLRVPQFVELRLLRFSSPHGIERGVEPCIQPRPSRKRACRSAAASASGFPFAFSLAAIGL